MKIPEIKFPEAVLAYAIEPKSRGDEDKISWIDAASERGGSLDQLHARPADPRTAAGRPGTAPHRGDGGEAEAAVRRRGEPEAAADSLPRDDYGLDRGPRPPQEADGRTRAVRRLQDQGRAAPPRQRLRIRRRHLRRLDSRVSTFPPSKRASRTRAYAGISPATRWSISAPLCSTARSTLSTRTNCRSRWPVRWPSRTR